MVLDCTWAVEGGRGLPCHPQDFKSTHSLTYNDPKLRGQTRNVSKNIEALNVVTFWSLNRVDSKWRIYKCSR